MIIDTSVLVALLREENDADQLIAAMSTAANLRISSGSWVELAAVVTRTMKIGEHERADVLMRALDIAVEPVSVEQARLARAAYREYGRGTGHPADLNFGDCFAYSLAKLTGEPLLFKGKDFEKTDVEKAKWRL